VQALTTLIASGGNDKDILLCTALHSIGEQWMGRTGRGEFTTTDVDDMGAMLTRLHNGSRQIELGTGGYPLIIPIRENGKDQAPTVGCNALDRPIVLAEYDAGDVGAMLCSWALIRRA
jgi:hypothetical protein